MKKILILSGALFVLACNNSKDNKENGNQDTTVLTGQAELATDQVPPATDPITDTLMKLPFIIKSNNYIDSFSNHKHGIAFISDTTGQEISVKAGYNGDERFETYYEITIDRKTGEIKVLDPIEGDHIPLKDYLKNNQ